MAADSTSTNPCTRLLERDGKQMPLSCQEIYGPNVIRISGRSHVWISLNVRNYT